MVGCQIVIAHVFSYSVSVFQFPNQFSPGFCSIFLECADWTEFSARAGDSALPGLLHLHLHCRIVCTCIAGLSAPALCLELSNKDCLLTRNWILSFCTVTQMAKHAPDTDKEENDKPFWRVPQNVFHIISVVYVKGESASMNIICVLSVVYA